jgi:hypothetical protein
MNEDDGDAGAKEDRLNKKTVAEKLAVEKWYQEQAKKQFEDEGTLEIDPGAAVSMGGDPGAYVQAWVWVDNPHCAYCEEPIPELERIPEDGEFICPKCKEMEEADDGGEDGNGTDAEERPDAPGTTPDGGA